MSNELIVTIWLDEDLGLSVQKCVMKGSTIADLKDELCKDDPSGDTRREDIVLTVLGSNFSESLADTSLVDETLLNLTIKENCSATRESSTSGTVKQDCVSTGVQEKDEDEKVELSLDVRKDTEAPLEPTASSERSDRIGEKIIQVLDDTGPDHTIAIKVTQEVEEPRHYIVAHKRVAIRTRPSTDGRVRGALSLGHTFKALPFSILDSDGEIWLHLVWSEFWRFTKLAAFEDAEGQQFGGWILMNGDKLGLGQLVKETSCHNEVDGELGAMLDAQSPLGRNKQVQPATEDEQEVVFNTAAEASCQVPAYFVTQGLLFKKPGSDPETTKLIKLERPVGSQVHTTGCTWMGPQGGEWVELDSSVEKPGWLLIGPGFGVSGPMLRRIDPGQEKPCVVWAAKPALLRDESNLQAKKFLLHPSDTIKDVKEWLSTLFGCTRKSLIVAGPIRDREDHKHIEYYNLQSEAFLRDSVTVAESGYSDGDEVQYVYTGAIDEHGNACEQY